MLACELLADVMLVLALPPDMMARAALATSLTPLELRQVWQGQAVWWFTVRMSDETTLRRAAAAMVCDDQVMRRWVEVAATAGRERACDGVRLLNEEKLLL